MEDDNTFWGEDDRPDTGPRVTVIGTADRTSRLPRKRPGWRTFLVFVLIIVSVLAVAGLVRDPPPLIGEQRTAAVRTVEELIEAMNEGDFDRYRSIMPESLLGLDGPQLAVCDTAACAAAELTPEVAAIEVAREQMAFWHALGSRWGLEDCDSGPSTAGGVWVTCEATFDSPIHRIAGESIDTNPTLWFRFEERGRMVLAGPILDRYSPPIDWMLDRYPPVQLGGGPEMGPCGLLPWAVRLDAACAAWMLDEMPPPS